MGQQEKAAYYNYLKERGIQFSKPYRNYSTDELAEAYTLLKQREAEHEAQLALEEPMAAPEPEQLELPDFDAMATMQALHDVPEPEPAPEPVRAFLPPPMPERAPEPQQARLAPPVMAKDPNELPGQRLNTTGVDEIIRVDEFGRGWIQEEVLKPSIPKPRGRRVLQTTDTGTVVKTVQDGQFIETFEVAGDGPPRTTEIKITLPSYQVGIYRDPRYPFKVVCYNGVEVFDLFEVEDFFGGPARVPAGVKRSYVSNTLGYDMRSVIEAISEEYRQLQLMGKI